MERNLGDFGPPCIKRASSLSFVRSFVRTDRQTVKYNKNKRDGRTETSDKVERRGKRNLTSTVRLVIDQARTLTRTRDRDRDRGRETARDNRIDCILRKRNRASLPTLRNLTQR